MKDNFFVLILSKVLFEPLIGQRIANSCFSLAPNSTLLRLQRATRDTCLLQIILASVQVTGVTGVVRRQGAECDSYL